jgi:excisionase family DNA binding protein
MLTVKELSAWLNIKSSTLYLWVSKNKIPCRRIHGLVRFEPEAIQAWLNMALRPIQPNRSRCRLVTIRRDLDRLIEAAKREVYTPRHGETRPKSGLIQKEDADGAV